jgi:hypothetical protein
MNTKIFEDNILSRNDIAVRYVFQKMFSPQGTLVAVECLSRFDNLSISPEDFSAMLPPPFVNVFSRTTGTD